MNSKLKEKNFDEAVQYFHQTIQLNPFHQNAQDAIANVSKNIFNT